MCGCEVHWSIAWCCIELMFLVQYEHIALAHGLLDSLVVLLRVDSADCSGILEWDKMIFRLDLATDTNHWGTVLHMLQMGTQILMFLRESGLQHLHVCLWLWSKHAVAHSWLSSVESCFLSWYANWWRISGEIVIDYLLFFQLLAIGVFNGIHLF